MVSSLISKLIMLIFGTLYPAYMSYKAIKNKDVREYVKWMMYWIIFALFITVETFADTFLAWLPLYYEIKIVFIIWLLSPATKGSSILYRKFVHPRLLRHEKDIDKYIAQAQRNSYATLMDVGRKGFNVATDTIVKTAVTGQYQLVETLKRYNSMQELRSANDYVDSAHTKRATWYGGMGPPDNKSFDPENDVDLLQRQYKPAQKETFIEEEPYEPTELQRSQSDNNLADESMDAYHTAHSVDMNMTSSRDNDDGIQMQSDHASDIDYNYTHSSNTLPRARKPKKPLYETYSSSMNFAGETLGYNRQLETDNYNRRYILRRSHRKKYF